MKAITVRQPWAWAIVAGGKDVENRTAAWAYRGPLAIHAGLRWSDRGADSSLIRGAFGKDLDELDPAFRFGALIGIVDLVDVHIAQPEILTQTGPRSWEGSAACCESAWAETAYLEQPTGRTRRDLVHLVLANPRPIDPLYCRGALGLWTVPDELEP